MKCIIVGVGKVGYSLAANLCAEGHEITVIDNNRRRLDIMEEHFNLTTIEGNAAKMATLKEADIENADLLIAVTEKDELNMVACFVAKNAGAASTIARVRNPGYSDFDDKARLDALGIDMLINPEKVSAEDIGRLIDYPEANYVGFFGNGRDQMLELRLSEDCPHLNVPLRAMNTPAACIMVAIEREGKLIIPRGDDVLKSGDELLILANTKEMPQIEKYLGIEVNKPHNIVILGGSLAGFYLAEHLEKRVPRLNVKILEDDYERCEEMAQTLNHTVIINSGGSSFSLYEDENISDADVFIATTEDDKENLFACVLAKNLGAHKTIAQIRGSEYAPVLENAGVDKIVSPSRLTADRILRFIDRSRILSLTRFNDSSGQVTEYVIPDNAKCTGIPLNKLDFPKKAIICMIIRGKTHIIANGSDHLEPGDAVLVFSMPEALKDVEKMLSEARG